MYVTDDRQLGVAPLAIAGGVLSVGKRLLGKGSTPAVQRAVNALNNLAAGNKYNIIAIVARGGVVPQGSVPEWSTSVNFSDGLPERAAEIAHARQLMDSHGESEVTANIINSTSAGPTRMNLSRAISGAVTSGEIDPALLEAVADTAGQVQVSARRAQGFSQVQQALGGTILGVPTPVVLGGAALLIFLMSRRRS